MKFLPHHIRLVILLLALGCGPDREVASPRQVTILLDRTDVHLLQTLEADIPELLHTLGSEADLWRAVDIRIATIGAVAYNKVQELRLPAEDPGAGNILVRKRRVKEYRTRVEELLRLHAEPRTEEASLVYLPLVLELEHLARCASCDREVVIYSDLVEHHGKGKWSLYDDVLLDSLHHAPNRFAAHFEAYRPLPELHGVKITVVNIPKSTANSERVTRVHGLYERMLQAHGATVRITGNYIQQKEP